MLRAVLLPPFDLGIMGSNSSFLQLPHFTHLASSRRRAQLVYARYVAAFWVIQLTEAKDACEIQNGARFVARFVKNRNSTEADCPPMEWHFHLPKGAIQANVSWKSLSTGQIFRQWIEDGITSATDIADEMGISKGQVSKVAKRAIAEGWLRKNGRDYVLTGKASRSFPSLHPLPWKRETISFPSVVAETYV
jgi:hypothetical protein